MCAEDSAEARKVELKEEGWTDNIIDFGGEKKTDFDHRV